MKVRKEVMIPTKVNSLLWNTPPPKIKEAATELLQTGFQIKGAVSASRLENICYIHKALPLKKLRKTLQTLLTFVINLKKMY